MLSVTFDGDQSSAARKHQAVFTSDDKVKTPHCAKGPGVTSLIHHCCGHQSTMSKLAHGWTVNLLLLQDTLISSYAAFGLTAVRQYCNN